MRLRVSGTDTGKEYGLAAVMGGGASDSGLPHADLLNAFAEGVCGHDAAAVGTARQALVDAMGARAMVDAAAVIAAFNAYPRMADATGIPLEDAKAAGTVELRTELGLEAFNRLKDEA